MFEFLAKFYNDNKQFIDSQLSGGAILLAVIGFIGGLIWALGKLIWWCIQQKRKQKLATESRPLPFDVIPPKGKVLPLVYNESDPNNNDTLADQNIPYQRRDCNEDYRQKIRDLLEEHRWVIILGPTGIGKTREAAEVAQRLKNEGWTILCLKLGAWLDCPTGEQLQELRHAQKLLFFLDNLNWYARLSLEVDRNPNAKDNPLAPINIPFQERLLKTLKWYEKHWEVRVIATARNETQPDSDGQPSEWEKLQWEKYPKLWDRFKRLELPNPEDGAIAELLQETVKKTDIQHQNADYSALASYNDSTFRNVVENLRILQNNKLPLDRANYRPDLKGTWEKLYRDAKKRDPLARYVYEAIDLLRQCDIPLEAFIVEPTARMIAGGNWWQKLRYRWQMPRSLANLEAREKILTPRDGQIEGKGKRTELTDYLYALARLVWKLFDRSPDRTEVALLKLSDKLTDLKRYPEALKGYNRLIHSNASYLWFQRGFVLGNLGRYEEALASFEKAIEFQPDDSDAWLNKGVALMRMNQNQEALDSFKYALELQPDNFLAWYNLGVCLGNLGEFEEEKKAYDKALELNPNDSKLLYNHGSVLWNLGNSEGSLIYYKKALELQPNYSQAWYARGVTLEKLGRHEEALASFDKALEFQPDDSKAWYYRGIVLGNLDRTEEALASFDKALEFQPDDSYTWDYRGVALGKLGRNEEALASFDRALEFRPDYSDTWYNRGAVLGKLGRNEEALASFDRAREIQPDDSKAWYGQGLLLGKLGRNEEALAFFDRALEIQPDDSKAWYGQGLLLEILGRNEEALASYDKALEIQPDDSMAWCNRGVVLAYLQRYQEALDSYRKSLTFNPNEAGVYYDIACCYALQENLPLTLENLQRAITLDEKYREMARTDKDFDRIREREEFKQLLDSP